MVFLFRVFALVVLLFLLRYLFASLIAHAKVALFGRPQRAEPQNEIIAGRAHKDPQCGTYVAEELAIKVSAAGKSYYFCSPECRDRFFQR